MTTSTDIPQNIRALEIANAQRTACRIYKDEIRAGRLRLEDAIKNCDLPITVYQLLTAAPRWGGVRADRAIHRAGLSGRNIRMGGAGTHRTITEHERGRLLMAIDPHNSRPTISRPLHLNSYQANSIGMRLKRAGCSDQLIQEVLAA